MENKNREKHYKSYIMVPIESVSRFKWNQELGNKLRQLRGKVSRRSFADKVKEQDIECSHQFIQQLEDGKAESISAETLLAICEALEQPLSEFMIAFRYEPLQ